jgi:hypothetical protein
MSNTLCRWFALAVLIAPAFPALGQSNRSSPGPQDPVADVPRTEYRSAFAQYRRYVQQPPAVWRDSNETVNRIGGWRAYAREATETPSSNTPAASSRSVHDAAKGHAGHEKKK